MPLLPNQHDIELYNLVHELLNQEKSSEGASERRRRSRRPFAAKHRIAPFRGGEMPGRDQFFTVRCRDLNEGGFAFLLPQRPDFRELVVAFGSGADQIQMLAAVAHCREVLVWASGRVERVPRDWSPAAPAAERMFQVGCRFVRRLEQP